MMTNMCWVKNIHEHKKVQLCVAQGGEWTCVAQTKAPNYSGRFPPTSQSCSSSPSLSLTHFSKVAAPNPSAGASRIPEEAAQTGATSISRHPSCRSAPPPFKCLRPSLRQFPSHGVINACLLGRGQTCSRDGRRRDWRKAGRTAEETSCPDVLTRLWWECVRKMF